RRQVCIATLWRTGDVFHQDYRRVVPPRAATALSSTFPSGSFRTCRPWPHASSPARSCCSARSIRSTRVWSACWPARVRSIRPAPPYARAYGEIEDEATYARVRSFVRAASAASRLKGQTFGLIGGRSMGMYTATADPAQWLATFGVDVEHIDQGEIVRLAAEVPRSEERRVGKECRGGWWGDE